MGQFGLDFGTSTTFVAEVVEGKPKSRTIGTKPGQDWVPSVVATDGKAFIFGEEALDHGSSSGKSLLRSIKREITDKKTFKEVDSSGNGKIKVSVDLAIKEFLSEIAKRSAEAGIDLSKAGSVRMGCPAMWDHEQRRRLASIAASAGISLEHGTLVDEAVAAGLSWLSTRDTNQLVNENVLIFDMGGGTLDVAILRIEEANPSSLIPVIKVLSSHGNPFAGDEVDESIANSVLGLVKKSLGQLTTAEKVELFLAVEQAKIAIGSDKSAQSQTLAAPNLPWLNGLKVDRKFLTTAIESSTPKWSDLLVLALRRATLNSTTSPVWSGTHARAAKIAPESDLAKSISSVVMIGGMCNVAEIQDFLMDFFPNAVFHLGNEPLGNRSLKKAQVPQEVALGLASQKEVASLNVEMPYFNIVLETEDKTFQVYNSNTRLYSPEDVRDEAPHLHYVWRLPQGESLPSSGTGTLSIVTNDGKPVKLKIASGRKGGDEKKEDLMDEIQFKFGSFNTPATQSGYDPRVIIFPSGIIAVFHGDGSAVGYIVDKWTLAHSKATPMELTFFNQAILGSYPEYKDLMHSLYGN